MFNKGMALINIGLLSLAWLRYEVENDTVFICVFIITAIYFLPDILDEMRKP